MTTEVEKAARRMDEAKSPAEKVKIKAEIDQMPLSGNEFADVQQREADRKQQDIKEIREKRNQ